MAAKLKGGGTYKLYSQYSFREKDPVIDRLRTIIQDQHVKYKALSDDSGVSAGTYYSWFRGKTRRPQFAPIMATLRALGYDLEIVDKTGDGGRYSMPTARSMARTTPPVKATRNGAAAAHH